MPIFVFRKAHGHVLVLGFKAAVIEFFFFMVGVVARFAFVVLEDADIPTIIGIKAVRIVGFFGGLHFFAVIFCADIAFKESVAVFVVIAVVTNRKEIIVFATGSQRYRSYTSSTLTNL